MSLSQQQYIEYVEEMIATPGWGIIVDAAKKEIYQLQADALEAKDWGAVQRSKGSADKLAEFIYLPDVIAAQRQQMEEEQEELADAAVLI